MDEQLGRVYKTAIENDYVLFITADHGNVELNVDPKTGEKHTAHTVDPVPFILTNFNGSLHKGTLADITPTILKILDIKKPESMTGESLID